MLDRRGARPPIILGTALGAVGFYLLAGRLTDLSLGKQTLDVMLAGGGLGLILGPASTDAVNRAPSTAYSEVTGISQTSRNFGASLGLAVLGAILSTHTRTNITYQLTHAGVPAAAARRVASSFTYSTPSSQSAAHASPHLVHAVQLAFAQSTQTVFYVMAGLLAATFILAVRFLPRGHAELEDRRDRTLQSVGRPRRRIRRA